MSIEVTDPSLSQEVQTLIKVCHHLCRKATPLHSDGIVIGYRVPKRELERVGHKIKVLGKGEES